MIIVNGVVNMGGFKIDDKTTYLINSEEIRFIRTVTMDDERKINYIHMAGEVNPILTLNDVVKMIMLNKAVK